MIKNGGVSEIAEKLGITKANASQHLAIMRGQNIVKPDARVSQFFILLPIQNSCCLWCTKKSIKRTAGNQPKIIRKILK